MTLFPIDAGDVFSTYRVTGSYPCSGYRAVDITDGSRIYIDVFSAEDWRDRTIQLLRAASIQGSLSHPGIARIHGRGVFPDRRPWIASELAEGVPLCDVLARRPLTADEAVALIRDLSEIVAHAHARNLVHGTIRPHLIVMRTGDKDFPIQLGGWGELRALESSDDARDDVYAIGELVYRGLTGKYPGRVPPAVIDGVPAPISSLVVRMLADRMTALEVLATSVRACGDRVLGGPRFSRPRWTPAPLPDGERVADIIDFAAARKDRA